MSVTLTYEQMFIYSYVMAVMTRARVGAEPSDRHVHDPAARARVAARLLDARAIDAVSEVFRLLGDPTRVRIVDALSHGERCVCDLATLVGLTESATSHQLRLLRASRLVRVRRAGRMAYYSLDDHHVAGLVHDTRKHVEEGHS
jgi:DNA-binding transcriptional ArsR family regulator